MYFPIQFYNDWRLTMRMGQAAELIGKHQNTIRNYAERFAEFLSASPGKGEHRNFTDEDVRILAFVSKLMDSGMDQNAITQTIRQRREDNKPFPPVLPTVSGFESRSLVPVAEMEAKISVITAELREAQGRLEELRRQSEMRDRAYADELTSLNREIGRLQAELDAERRRNEK